jgi:hypothetical protein
VPFGNAQGCEMPEAALPRQIPRLPRWQREFLLGFAYWLALVVVLEPGNVMRADGALPVGHEVLRLMAAGLLGASITPLVFTLARRLPIEGEARWARSGLHLLAAAGIAAWLIVVAGVLAWRFGIDGRPLGEALRLQFAADGLLLFFAVAVLDAIAQALFFFRRAQDALDAPPAVQDGHLTSVAVKTRGRVTLLDLATVRWIETQGNYLALHDGTAAHLIRETSSGFEAKLDPKRFARIHRQTIVALDRVREIASLPSGDATVTVDDGTRLRMSRGYRDAVRTKFEARGRSEN